MRLVDLLGLADDVEAAAPPDGRWSRTHTRSLIRGIRLYAEAEQRGPGLEPPRPETPRLDLPTCMIELSIALAEDLALASVAGWLAIVTWPVFVSDQLTRPAR